MSGIGDRMFARVGEPVDLQTRTDAPALSGGQTITYATFAANVPAKVVELGSQYLGQEQLEEAVTHLVTIAERADAAATEYVIYAGRRMRVHRHRLIGPPDIRFRQIFCEAIERQ